MPRIRTLKPEHRQHRKVGPLTDREYRLWVGMILEADDDGRLVADPAFLRASVFTYQAKLTVAQVDAALRRLDAVGLVHLYRVGGIQYAEFPSWADHQKIDRKTPTKLPMCDDSSKDRRADDEGSLLIGSEGSRSEGSEGSGMSPRRAEGPDTWPTAEWPSPEALVHLYNTEGPDNLPAVETLSLKRREAARRLLRQFPARAWWCEVFAEYKASRFLSGKTPPGNGHGNFKPDFDWLMQTGKKGAENAVRVHDGVYR